MGDISVAKALLSLVFIVPVAWTVGAIMGIRKGFWQGVDWQKKHGEHNHSPSDSCKENKV